MSNDTQIAEVLSSDVTALCALLARILQRCIAEQDAQILHVYKPPSWILRSSSNRWLRLIGPGKLLPQV